MITNNASVHREGDQTVVTVYKEFYCPACGRCLCEIKGIATLKIACKRCGAFWKVDAGVSTCLSPPKRVCGKMLLDGVEKFYRKNQGD